VKKSIVGVACAFAVAALPASAGASVGGEVVACSGGNFGALVSGGAQSGFKLGQHQVPGKGGGAGGYVAAHCG
jgi:hypothetical protein